MSEIVFDPEAPPPFVEAVGLADRTPHFRVPFRMTRQGVATVEQDTVEEITQCVFAVLATEVGSRQEEPDFGILDQSFVQGGADLEDIEAAVSDWEPRASLLPEVVWDGLLQTVTETVSVASD